MKMLDLIKLKREELSPHMKCALFNYGIMKDNHGEIVLIEPDFVWPEALPMLWAFFSFDDLLQALKKADRDLIDHLGVSREEEIEKLHKLKEM